jgi:GxxExxY protein
MSTAKTAKSAEIREEVGQVAVPDSTGHAQAKDKLNEISGAIIGAAIEVHRELGPGLLESAYETCLAYELAERGLNVRRQVEQPVTYRGLHMDCGYRIDLLVDGVVVELKAVDSLNAVHKAQVLSYLKLSGCQVGLLINFNVKLLKDGVQRIVNGFQD